MTLLPTDQRGVNPVNPVETPAVRGWTNWVTRPRFEITPSGLALGPPDRGPCRHGGQFLSISADPVDVAARRQVGTASSTRPKLCTWIGVWGAR